MANQQVIERALTLLIEYYGGRRDWNETKKNLYARALGKLTDSQVQHAIDKHIETSIYFPKISELLLLANEVDQNQLTQGEYWNQLAHLQTQKAGLAGKNDPDAWRKLAQAYAEIGQIHNQNFCLTQAEKIENISKEK